MTRDEWRRYLARERQARRRARLVAERSETLSPDERERLLARSRAGRKGAHKRRK